MSNLSSIASAILGNITGTTKPEAAESAAPENAFLHLLSSRSGNFSDLNSDQSLVDSLYNEEDEQPDPVASPLQVPTQVYVYNKMPEGVDRAAFEERAAPEADAETAPLSRQESPSVSARSETKTDAPQPSREVPAAQSDAKTKPANASANSGDMATDTSTVAQKIRAKLNELSDILSAITALLGGVGTSSVTVVRVTQITQISQQNLSGNTPFIDLSDRFQQLIQAVESAQNLSADGKQALTIAFGQFQSVAFSVQPATADIPAADAELNLAKLQGQLQAFLAQFASLAKGGKGVDSGLQESVADLNQWVSEVRDLLKQAGAPKLEQPILQQSAVSNSPAELSDATSSRVSAENEQAIISSPLLQAQASNTPGSVNTNNATASGALVSVAENAAGNSANFSNNSGSGQGGDRPGTQAISAAASGAAQNNSGTQETSFARTLKAASHTPVAEQVMVHIKTMVKDGGSKIEIQLDPHELGKLTIKMEVGGDGKTGVVVTADSKQTLDLLQRDARGLERALADAGLKTDSGSLSFNLRGGDSGKQEQQQASAGYSKMQPEEDPLLPLAIVSRSYTIQLTDGLDIKI